MNLIMDTLIYNSTYYKFIFGSSLFFAFLFIGIIVIVVHRYYVKKKSAGDKIVTIKRPFDVLGRKICSYILIFLIFNLRISSNLHFILPNIYSCIALVIFVWFDLQPQQIYEKGILVSIGFIKWSEIQSVESADKREHLIKIKLVKSKFGNNILKIYCYPGMATNFVDLITQHLNNDIDI